MLNKYVPQVDAEGNVLWDRRYIKNVEIKKMPIPYKNRKEYYKRYRETHRDKIREYARNFLKRRKLAIIRKMIEEKIT